MSTKSQTNLTTESLEMNTKGLDEEAIRSVIQGKLRYFYSQRLFVHDVIYEPEDQFLTVDIGIAYPQDVSDSRIKDNVLKMVNIGDVFSLTASPRSEEYYVFELPDRTSVYSEFRERHEELLADLDWTMARAIFGKVYQLNPVRNQLNSVIQIVNWVRREDNLTIDDIAAEQTTDNTKRYIEVLADLNFLRLQDEIVRPGPKIESADLQSLSRREYERRVVGDIVADGYYVLRRELGLRMLNHFPKFANAYYISAFRRNKPDLWLTIDDIMDNLENEYGEGIGRRTVEDKLWDLSRVDVLKLENDEVSGVSEIYQAAQTNQPIVG